MSSILIFVKAVVGPTKASKLGPSFFFQRIETLRQIPTLVNDKRVFLIGICQNIRRQLKCDWEVNLLFLDRQTLRYRDLKSIYLVSDKRNDMLCVKGENLLIDLKTSIKPTLDQ